MPAHPPPPPSTSGPSGTPALRPGETRPSGPDAAASEPAPEGTLFHLLLERGWDAALAYTAIQRVHTMTSEIAAAGLQPVLAELRQMREMIAEMRERFATRADLAGFATKADLAGFATKADLAAFITRADLKAALAGFATKADLKAALAGFATKADLKAALAGFVTKADLKAALAGFVTRADLADLRREIAEREARIIKWMFGAMAAQTALIVGLVSLLK